MLVGLDLPLSRFSIFEGQQVSVGFSVSCCANSDFVEFSFTFRRFLLAFAPGFFFDKIG